MIPGCGKDREDEYDTGSRNNFLEKNRKKRKKQVKYCLLLYFQSRAQPVKVIFGFAIPLFTDHTFLNTQQCKI
ncbi:MAG TPA: hypothetical protein DCF33_06450 [Saprospirales bacterium]|nr:hypothetical protein [Saprospirales bacterium]